MQFYSGVTWFQQSVVGFMYFSIKQNCEVENVGLNG